MGQQPSKLDENQNQQQQQQAQHETVEIVDYDGKMASGAEISHYLNNDIPYTSFSFEKPQAPSAIPTTKIINNYVNHSNSNNNNNNNNNIDNNNKVVNVVENVQHEVELEPEEIMLSKLPVMLPYIPTSIKHDLYLEKITGAPLTDFDTFDVNSISRMMAVFKVYLQDINKDLDKRQDTTNRKVKEMEVLCTKANQLMIKHVTIVKKTMSNLPDVNKMIQNLKETQQTMNNVLLSIDKLTKLLPDDLQLEEAIEFSETLKKSPISSPTSYTYNQLPESNTSLKVSISNIISRVKDKKAIWIEDIIPKMSTLRYTGKVKELTRRGIDKDIRGLVWQTALENHLNIEPKLYQRFLEKWGDRIETNIAADSPSSSYSNTSTGSNDVHSSLSSSLSSSNILTSTTSSTTQTPPPASPPNGFNSTEEAILYSFSMIDIDLPRTFASFSLLNHESSQFRKQLQRILKAYANFSPKLGYVQGMSYLAAMLLLHMEEYQSFVCFCNLLNNRFLQSLYQLKMKELDKYMNAFELMLSHSMPKLYEHFQDLTMLPHHYLIQWWMTVFCQSLPLPVCIRVWDCFIVEGNLFLFVTALGILFHYKKQLEEGSLEFCKNFLANLPNDLDADSLFRSIDNINISYCSQIYANIEKELADDVELQSIEQQQLNINAPAGGYQSFDLGHSTSADTLSPQIIPMASYEYEEDDNQHHGIDDQLRFSANSIVNLSPRKNI